MPPAVIGVDVGTGSARAGVFDLLGHKLGSAVQAIRMWQEPADRCEQSSADIWRSVCLATRAALAAAGPVDVHGIGFDATCSLVALDAADAPRDRQPGRRRRAERHRLDGPPGAGAGGAASTRRGTTCCATWAARISPEMQTPKLLWLRSACRRLARAPPRFFDLPDFLT